MSGRFLMRGVGTAACAAAVAASTPWVREAWTWGALGWTLPTLTLLLPGAWWIAHPDAPVRRRIGVIGGGFLLRLASLGGATAWAAATGGTALGAYLAAMSVTYLALQVFETVALRRELRDAYPALSSIESFDRAGTAREGA